MNDLRELLHTDKVRIEKIPLEEIQVNPNNFYDENTEETGLKIEALCESIRMNGLMEPILLHQTEDGDYMIISGNTRYKAVKALFDEGIGPGTIDSIVVREELSEEELEFKSVSGNLQRVKTWRDFLAEASIMEKKFDQLRSEGLVSGRKDDYVAKALGISPRTLRNYRTKAAGNKSMEENDRSADDRTLEKALMGLYRKAKKTWKAFEAAGEGDTASRLEDMVSQIVEIIEDQGKE